MEAEETECGLLGSAAAAAASIARREFSSRELTERLLRRIESINPMLNAVVEVAADSARQAADAADLASAHGEWLGPLHGVPITVKEALPVAGLGCTWGNPDWRNFRSAEDATVVRRLRRAGAIVVGTTNVAEMLGDFAQTRNDVYGVTNNPWDIGRTPGGSSGGSAAAVAAGMSFLDFGSDLVGSVRIPASFCGVYGLRPTVGVVPLTGFAPPGASGPASELSQLSVLGPLARSAGDLRLALRATAGPEEPAATALSWALPPPRHRHLHEFRVGVMLDDRHAAVTAEVGAALSDTVDALARAGATIIEGWPAGVDPAEGPEAFDFQLRLFFAVAQPEQDEFAPLSTVIAQDRRRTAIRAAWAEYFSHADVFVCPVNFTAAFDHDPRPFGERVIATPAGARGYFEQPFWITHASLPGLPAVAAPVGQTSNGLPVGAQIIGPCYEDDTAIAFAELLTSVSGGYRSPPLHPAAA